MSTSTNNTSLQNLDELDRQIKQSEMIRQYLQITNIDRNTASVPTKSPVPTETESNTTDVLPLSAFNFNEIRLDLKMAEERVERLRQEIKELQRKRDEPFVKTLPPPPPYIPPNINKEYANSNLSTSTNRNILEMSTLPIVQELLSSQQNSRPIMTNAISSSVLMSNYNVMNHFTPNTHDISTDHRHRKLYLALRQQREQLLVYLDSLKQALNSLDRVVSLQPTNNEIQQTNAKFDTIQEKTRQLHALKSNRSYPQSPFIECRIRQLEHDLVFMLSEHQKDVQAKLELNEQRSVILLKIMQITDELALIEQQIQQILPNATSTTDFHLLNSSPLANEFNQQSSSSSFRLRHSPNNVDGRRISFREPADNNPLSKLPPAYYPHH